MAAATPRPLRRSRAEREFGLLVGTVLAALGAWWWYRGRFALWPAVLAGIGGLLIVLGAFWPRALVVPRRLWMALAERLGAVMTVVVLGLVFFFVLTPIGLVKRLTGWDPLLRRAASRGSWWAPYSPRQRDRQHYEKMF